MPKPTSDRKLSGRPRAVAEGYCSGLEDAIAAYLERQGVGFKFEAHTLPYQIPARHAKYTPDFYLGNGIIIESKGRFLTPDRQKMVLVRKQHPDLDIRFVFDNMNAYLVSQKDKEFQAWAKATYGLATVPRSGPRKVELKAAWLAHRKAHKQTCPSQTTKAMWAKKNGFRCATQVPPVEWLLEPPNEASLAALQEIINGTS